jgi:probable F420-dependent oxidoreductase
LTLIRVALGPAGIPALRAPSDGAEFLAFVARAEQLGYAGICLGDHLDGRGAPLVALAAAAVRTQRLTLAAHVLCNDLRNVAVLAQEARSIQVLSGGRLELGLGTGWLRRDFERAGIEMAPFGERLARVEAAAVALRELTAGSELPAPPLVLGGGGPAMLAAAARHADIVTINIPLRAAGGLAANSVASGTRDAFEERIRVVRSAAAEVDREVELHTYVHEAHLGESWVTDAAARAGSIGLTVDDYLDSPHVLAGDADIVAGRLVERARELGLRYVSIPGACLEAFAPVLEVLRT